MRLIELSHNRSTNHGSATMSEAEAPWNIAAYLICLFYLDWLYTIPLTATTRF